MAGWLNTEINARHRKLNPDTVTRLSTNRVRRSLTSLIEANAKLLLLLFLAQVNKSPIAFHCGLSIKHRNVLNGYEADRGAPSITCTAIICGGRLQRAVDILCVRRQHPARQYPGPPTLYRSKDDQDDRLMLLRNVVNFCDALSLPAPPPPPAAPPGAATRVHHRATHCARCTTNRRPRTAAKNRKYRSIVERLSALAASTNQRPNDTDRGPGVEWTYPWILHHIFALL